MNLSIGIVGLPNVGKSTLFNALLKKQQAFVANYPFATIEPNVGVIPVPDKRLDKIAQIESSKNVVPAVVKFIDIAGIVKGAAEGEGLGNKFLAHIREVNAICQVVRHFKSTDVIHVSSTPDPASDFEVISTELILADLQTLEKSKSKDPKLNVVVEKLKVELNKGVLAKDVALSDEEKEILSQLQLLTNKSMFIVANVDEEDLKKDFGPNTTAISAQIESELSMLSEEEQKDYLSSLGVEESGLERIIKKGYEVLNLISFLTAGEKEARAWTIEKGTDAQNAAGVIHTDFIKNFIKAEVIAYEDFVAVNGWKNAREQGKTRFEGRDYIIKDGEVVEFKIGN
ncbi:MAG TPA: redox-regulated ATPase YchF [Patescibacteria group bacterium]|nr:redox-regulated ATPase YchF [Patescibacteria group bacterium]